MGEPGELLTARLRLRRWRAEDAAPMRAINSDPEVARYLNAPTDERSIAEFHGLMEEHWATHGFGFSAVELRATGQFAGFAGVAYPAFLADVAGRPEIGWRLAREHWGRGLATEAATAARDDALGRRGLGTLIAVIHPENRRSQRVATKLGLHVEQLVAHPALGRMVEIWRTP